MNLYSFPEEKIIIKIFKNGPKDRFISSSNGIVSSDRQVFLLTNIKFINKVLKIF